MAGEMILHSDLNCFYASVEMNENPWLRGKAIAVCGSTEDRHGIVLTASYPAKRMGVKTGAANWQARQCCPGLICVPPHYELYLKYSKLVRRIHNAIVQATDMQGVTGPTAGQFLIHDSLELFCAATHGDHPNQISLWISQSKIMRAVFTFITFQIWIWKIDKELIFDYVETTFPQHSILRV